MNNPALIYHVCTIMLTRGDRIAGMTTYRDNLIVATMDGKVFKIEYDPSKDEYTPTEVRP